MYNKTLWNTGTSALEKKHVLVASAIIMLYVQEALNQDATAGGGAIPQAEKKRRVFRPRMTCPGMHKKEIVERYRVDRETLEEICKLCHPYIRTQEKSWRTHPSGNKDRLNITYTS